jgi:hypothetical protein
MYRWISILCLLIFFIVISVKNKECFNVGGDNINISSNLYLTNDDACKNPVDCVGHWEPNICQADCNDQTYNITTKASGGGEKCLYGHNTIRQCIPVRGECKVSCDFFCADSDIIPGNRGNCTTISHTLCKKSYHTYYDDKKNKNINYKCKNDPQNASKCAYSWEKLNDDNCDKTCKREYYQLKNNKCIQFFPSRDQLDSNQLPTRTFSTNKCGENEKINLSNK